MTAKKKWDVMVVWQPIYHRTVTVEAETAESAQLAARSLINDGTVHHEDDDWEDSETDYGIMVGPALPAL